MTSPGFRAEFSLQKGRHVTPRQLVASRHIRADVAADRSVKMTAGIPVYGNWCGPGHGGESGPPIDPVDQVCCRHDKCYDQRGYFDCLCDQDLLNAMPGAIADSRTPPDGIIAGMAIIAAFEITPCLCNQICLPFTGVCIPAIPPVPPIPGTKQCPPPYS